MPTVDESLLASIWGTNFSVMASIMTLFGLAYRLINDPITLNNMWWFEWTMAVAILGVIGFQTWAMGLFWDAIAEPTAASTFRAWRVNLVVWFMAVSTIVASFLFWLVFTNFPNQVVTPGQWSMYAVGIGLSLGFSSWMILVYMKSFWYSYDPEGSMRNREFDFFGNDRPREVEEEDETVEEGEEEEADDF